MGSYIYFISVSKELLVPASALSCVSCVHFSWLCTFHAHVYACKYFFNPFFQKWHRGALTQPHIFSFWWRPGRKSSLTEWWSWTALSSLAGRHSNRPRGWTMPFLRVVGIDIWCNKKYNKNISGVLSAKHGLLFYDNQRFWFKDTNSRNGSWLNNVQIFLNIVQRSFDSKVLFLCSLDPKKYFFSTFFCFLFFLLLLPFLMLKNAFKKKPCKIGQMFK